MLLFSQCQLQFVQLRNRGMLWYCLDYDLPGGNPTDLNVTVFGCHGQGGNQVRYIRFFTETQFFSRPQLR